VNKIETVHVFIVNQLVKAKRKVINVMLLKFTGIFKPDDVIKVISKESARKKSRVREGKVISVNERFLTVNLGNYKESLDIFKVNQGLILVTKPDYV